MLSIDLRGDSNSTESGCAVTFLEANPFASRLHVLESLVEGVPEDAAVAVVVPARGPGADLDTFVASLANRRPSVSVTFVGKETRRYRITLSLLVRLLLNCLKTLRRHDRGALVLTAVDDYFTHLPFLALLIRVLFPRTKIIIFRYRVADLTVGGLSDVRQRLKSFCLKALERFVGPETVIFDERVQLIDRHHVIPDPWSGPFGTLTRAEARQLLGWHDEEDVVLLVGRQDERKGFDVAVGALASLNTQRPNTRVVLIGGVATSMQGGLTELARSYGKRLSHIVDYLSDEDISVYFTAASCVLLPYNLAFTSTSGVLVRAAASSTPVVASDHGLVGWRTEMYRLGRTFSYPRQVDLVRAVVEVLDHPFDPSGARAFAQSSTKQAVALAFRSVLNA